MVRFALISLAILPALTGCAIPEAEFHRGRLLAGMESNLERTAAELEGFLAENVRTRSADAWAQYDADRRELFAGLKRDGLDSVENLMAAQEQATRTHERLKDELEAYAANLARPVTTLRQTVDDLHALEAMRLRERDVPGNVMRHALGRASTSFGPELLGPEAAGSR